MSKEEEKYYTPEEAAAKVLEKAHELMKKSELFKNNTSHEIEAGEEPSNDDAECPEYLAEADIEDDYREDEKRKGEKKEKTTGEAESSEDEDGVSEEEAEAMEDIAEDEVGEHNEQLHEGKEHESDEKEPDEKVDKDDSASKDTERIVSEAANEKDKKPKMGKSEDMKAMSSKEDYDLDESGEYPHGSLGGKDKDKQLEKKRKMKKALAASEQASNSDKMKMDLKKPSRKQKLRDFMKKRKMKKAGGYPTGEARRRADEEKRTRMATPQESTEVADRKGYTRMPTPREKDQLKQKKNRSMEKRLGIKSQSAKKSY